jgi:hypothetical protein
MGLARVSHLNFLRVHIARLHYLYVVRKYDVCITDPWVGVSLLLHVTLVRHDSIYPRDAVPLIVYHTLQWAI